MGRIRICQFITELGPAGAERCVYELATRLDRELFDVQVMSLRGGAVADWLIRAGIKTTSLNLRGKWDLPRLQKIVRRLKAEKIDILHTHLFHADVVGRLAARLAGIPHLVHTVHVAERRFRPWRFGWARLASGWCDRIVCVSGGVQVHHAAHSRLSRRFYQVIPNGVDLSAYFSDRQSRTALRQQWGVGDSEVLVAFVGRLDRQKGIDTLVGAVTHLAARGSPVRLVIAGDGPMREMVETFIACGEGGQYARRLGLVEDVRGVLSAADMLVMPSRWEGFGLAAAEAMAAGLGVIATRVAGLDEVVADGQTGILVEPEDYVGLAEAMANMLGDRELRERFGRAGRQRVSERYNIADTIAAHQKLYTELAG